MLDKIKSLTPETIRIVKDKGTEFANSGAYCNFEGVGTYLCKRCGIALFRSTDKFLSSCGWPSFDDEIKDRIIRKLDNDGSRTEILCSRCDSHLGHIFTSENLTTKNRRYCVNSLSIDFVNSKSVEDTREIFLAGGCFWGLEYYLSKHDGVLKAESGYMGGHKINPTYKDICKGDTGHLEVVRVLYDCDIGIKSLIKLFFEIHDPCQANGQGFDIGDQYLSAIFCYDKHQASTAQILINDLIAKGFDVVTKIKDVSTFWKAEDYHQDYYAKDNKMPNCHSYVKRF